MPVELPTVDVLFVTLAVTAIRTTVEASPTILAGVLVAAWFRTRATPERVKNVFLGTGLRGQLRTVLVGMTLPVCSLGVLPVLRELRRLGLPTSKLITLAIVAPLLNPVSMLYGLTVLSATPLLLVIATSGALAIVVGDVSSRFAVFNKAAAEEPPSGLTGGTRLRNLVVAAGRIVTGWPLIDLLIVVVVSGAVTALVPVDTFGLVCAPSNGGGPATASLLALPQYVGPSRGVIQYAAIERAGLSVPTGLALYVFGVGVGAGNVLLLTRWYGLRRVAAVAVAMFLFVSAAAYASGALLRPSLGAVDETTGLDSLTRPAVSTIGQLGEAVSESLWWIDPLTIVGSVAFWILVPAGALVRLAKVGYRDDAPEAQSGMSSGRMSKAVPASQLGAIAVCGIAIFCGLATYIFFPSPSECMEEMQSIQFDTAVAIRSGNVSEALGQIDAWDSVAAKLPVSAAVYWSFPNALQRQATRDLRMALYNTRTLLQEGDVAAAKKEISALLRLLSETKDTFGESSS